MANASRFFRSFRLPTRKPAPRRLAVLRLEDRVTPSISVPLNAFNWTAFGPSPLAPAPEGQAPATPGNLPTAGRVISVINPAPPPGATPAQVAAAADTLLVSSAGGGVWRSLDAGQTWSPRTDNLVGLTILDQGDTPAAFADRTLKMGAMAASPVDGRIVWAGEGSPGFTDYDFLFSPGGQEHPLYPDLNYAGRGLLKSTDGGTTWKMIKGPANGGAPAFEGVAIEKVVPHPTDPNVCFVVTLGSFNTVYGNNAPNAVWRTKDGGLTWVNVTARLPEAPLASGGQPLETFRPLTDFTLDPSNPNVAYVAIGDPNRFIPGQGYIGNGVYRTTAAMADDPQLITYTVAFGGQGATVVPGSALGAIRVEVAPSQPNFVYATVAVVNVPAGREQFAAFRSIDSGVTFSQVALPQYINNYGGYNQALVIDPTNPLRLVVGGRSTTAAASSLYISVDGGSTWENISVGSDGAGPAQVVRSLRFDSAGRLLAATDGGAFRYTFPAVGGTVNGTWESLNGAPGTGLAITETTAVGLSPTTVSTIIGSTYGAGTFLFSDPGDPVNGPVPMTILGPDGITRVPNPAYLALFSPSVTDPTPFSGSIQYDPINPTVVYRAISRVSGQGGPQVQIVRSPDGGQTWAPLAGVPGNNSSFDIPAFEVDPGNGQRLYVGTDKLYISEDGGASYVNGISLNATGEGRIAVPDLPYVSGGGFAPAPFANPGHPITAIGTSRSNFRIVYVAVNQRSRVVNGGIQAFGPAIYRINTGAPEPQRNAGTAYWRDVSPGLFFSNTFDPQPVQNPIIEFNPTPQPPFDLPGGLLLGTPLPQGVMGTIPPFPYLNELQGIVTDLQVDPTNANVVYATVDTDGQAGRVYRSVDGGNSWTDISRNLGVAPGGTLPGVNNLRPYTVVLDPNQLDGPVDDTLFVGTSTGVWGLTDLTNSTAPQWIQVGGELGMPDVQVQDLKINTATGVLAAATFGRGVWEFQVRPLLSGSVFVDLNGNGVRDRDAAGAFTEPPRQGVTVEAFNVADNAVNATTVTLSNGFYEFRALRNGTYTIRVAGGVAAGEFSTTGLLPTPNTYTITQTTTIPGDTGPDGVPRVTPPADLGSFILTDIRGVLFDDLNGDGVRTPNEPTRAGQTVRLLTRDKSGVVGPAVNPATGKAVPDAVTDANGVYVFAGLAPSQDKSSFDPATGFFVRPYVVQLVVPAGTVQSSPLVGDIRLTSGAVFAAGTDIGTFTLVTVQGTVFDDSNGDGVRQGEPALAGVTVRLLTAGSDSQIGTADDVVLGTQVSGPNGQYSFPDLGPGKYYVQELTGTLPPGYRVTTANPQGPFSPQSGQGLASPPRDPAVPALLGPFDFGNFRDAGLRGVVFEDDNGDGRQQPTETRPIVGATVILIDPGADGDSRTEADNVVLETTTTDAGGGYTFAGRQPLVPGNGRPYFTRVVQPSNLFVQTSADARAQLTSGILTGGLNLGYFRKTSVSGFAFEDVNGNGVQDAGEPAAANFPVSLLNSNDPSQVVAVATTDGTGQYRFADLGPLQLNAATAGPGGAVIAYRIAVNLPNVVQTNAPGDLVLTSGVPAAGPTLALFRTVGFGGVIFDDTDGNGSRGAGEPGVPGVTVQLVTAGGQVALNPATGQPIQATTAADGSYTIQAPNGTFTVRLANLPADTLTATAVPGVVTTFSGQVLPPIDLGVFRAFAVAGVVFDDTNGNGTRDAGENGLGNVQVRLTTTAGLPTAFTATTLGDGSYTIPGVGPGVFRLAPVLPPGLFFTSPPGPVTLTATSGLVVPSPDVPTTFGVFRGAAVTGNVFEDLNRSGTPDANEVGSAGFTVQVVNGGGQVLAAGVSDAAGNYTIGNVPAGAAAVQLAPRPGFLATLSPVPLGAPLTSGGSLTAGRLGGVRLGSVEGRVFSDGNRNGRPDNTEGGLVGVTVELVQNGAVVATQASGANGFFQFLGLAGGQYTLRVNPSTLATGRVQTGPQLTGLVYPLTVTEGSGTAGNQFLGLDFGVAGRKRYAVSADGGGGPRVQVYDAVTGVKVSDQFVYEETFTGGVRVASGDVNGDGVDDLITVAGVGGGPRVRALDGVTGATLYDYFAYEPTFRLGLFVAAADVNGDGFADIITGTDSGGGPRVTVFSGRDGSQLLDFFAFDPEFRGGVRIGAGDIDGDGRAEVIAASGPGLEAEVRVFAFDGRRVNTFNPLDAAFTGGLFVAGGATDPGTGRASVLVGTGAGFADQGIAYVVDGLSGQMLFQLEAFPQRPEDVELYRGDVRVASFDTTGDSVPEIVIASGAGTRSQVRFLDGNNRREIATINPFEAAFLGGLFIG